MVKLLGDGRGRRGGGAPIIHIEEPLGGGGRKTSDSLALDDYVNSGVIVPYQGIHFFYHGALAVIGIIYGKCLHEVSLHTRQGIPA